MSRTEQRIENYYRGADFSPIFKMDKSFFKHRQLRFLLENGSMVKVADTINNENDLRKAFLKYKPRKAYYMCSRFLSPQTVSGRWIRGKPGYVIAQNIFICQDRIVFDLDVNARSNAEKLIKFFKERNIEIEYVIKSGSRGFHISIKREIKCPCEYPVFREFFYIEQNKKLIAEINAAGIEIDQCVFNSRQVIKIPLSLSVNSDGSAKVCEFIDHISGLEIAKGEMKGNTPRKIQRTEPTNPRSPRKHCGITNAIIGTKRNYCLFLKTGFSDLEKAKRKAEYLIGRYALSDCYLFRIDGEITIVCLKTMQKNRIRKIMRHGIGLQAFLNYKKSFIEMHDAEYVSMVEGNNNCHASRKHREIIGLFAPVREYEGYSGSGFQKCSFER